MENTAVKPNYELMPWETLESTQDENGNITSYHACVNTSEMPPLNKIKHFAEQILDVALTNIPEDQERRDKNQEARNKTRMS